MRRSVLVLALVLFAGCAKNPAAPAAGASNPDSPVHGAPLKGSAPAAVIPQAPQPALATVSGVVQETLDASDYTYMRLKTSGGETWAAVSKDVREEGRPGHRRERDVDGRLRKQDAEPEVRAHRLRQPRRRKLPPRSPDPPPAPVSAHGSASEAPQRSQMAAQHAAVAGGPADAGDVAVAKAEGKDARTVAQVFAERLSLKDKTVSVRGKVVKANSSIMGRNWIHIRDGSGSREKKDDDLTVTTQDGAAVGDIVVVKGVVHVDRDFGAGYSYPVVLEDAKVTREPASTRADATRP